MWYEPDLGGGMSEPRRPNPDVVTIGGHIDELDEGSGVGGEGG